MGPATIRQYLADNWSSFISRWRGTRDLLQLRPSAFFFGALLILINRVAGLAFPVSTKFLVDDILVRHRTRLLLPLCIAILGATVIHSASSFGITTILAKHASHCMDRMRRTLQSHVIHLPLSFFTLRSTGGLTSTILYDADALSTFLESGIVEFAGGIVTSVAIVVLLLRISTKLATLSLFFAGAFLAILLRAVPTLRPINSRKRDHYDRLAGMLTESLEGVATIKVHHIEKTECQRFGDDADQLLAANYLWTERWSRLDAATKALSGLLVAVVTFVGAREVSTGRNTLGDLLTFNVLIGYLLFPIIQMVAIGAQLAEATVVLARARLLLEHTVEFSDAHSKPPAIEGEVTLENVAFGYEQGVEVLHGISFSVPAGTMTALVGPSGSGKSTILKLVAALYKPQTGVVRVDGADISVIPPGSYRSQIGVVLQECFLFSRSIRDNVLLAKPNTTERDFLRACRIAKVDEFARKYGGYDTVVGERGVRLSTGEKQRIAIARAIIGDPAIVLLDEATSNLDSESEASILDSLWNLPRASFIVIAHRIATIRRAEQILFIESGCIVEQGSFDQLINAGRRFAELYLRQCMQSDWAVRDSSLDTNSSNVMK
jgi:ABC-type bacteriocin/lantibiotic exporter with double-glycine peptidase domain